MDGQGASKRIAQPPSNKRTFLRRFQSSLLFTRRALGTVITFGKAESLLQPVCREVVESIGISDSLVSDAMLCHEVVQTELVGFLVI